MLELLQHCRAHASALVHGSVSAHCVPGPVAGKLWTQRGSLSMLQLAQVDRTWKPEHQKTPTNPSLGVLPGAVAGPARA